jgi:hypothetical protein
LCRERGNLWAGNISWQQIAAWNSYACIVWVVEMAYYMHQEGADVGAQEAIECPAHNSLKTKLHRGALFPTKPNSARHMTPRSFGPYQRNSHQSVIYTSVTLVEHVVSVST